MSNRKNDWNHKNIWNHGYVTTPQAHLYYEISGHGTPILFLHGNSQSHHIFHSYARKLQGSYQVILMDSRSMNLSNAVTVVVYEAWRQLGYPGALLRD